MESKAYTDRHSRIPLVALSTLAAIDDSTAPASGQPPRLRKIFSKSLETPGLSAKNDTPSSLQHRSLEPRIARRPPAVTHAYAHSAKSPVQVNRDASF